MLDAIFFEFFFLLYVVLCVITLMDLSNYNMQMYFFCVYINYIVAFSLQNTTLSCLFSKWMKAKKRNRNLLYNNDNHVRFGVIWIHTE